MNTTHTNSQEKIKNNSNLAACPDLHTYSLKETSTLNFLDEIILESLIKNRPIRIFCEIESNSFKAVVENFNKYYASRGYCVSFNENPDEYFLVVLTRSDYSSIGLEDYSFEDFINYKAHDASTYLAKYKDLITNDFIDSCSRITNNNSGYSKEDELSILDEFFN